MKALADPELQQAVDELNKTFRILAEDVDESRAYGRENPAPFAHRTLLRTNFAVIEGMTYSFRQVALAAAAKSDLFSPAEIALLKEESYYLNKKGQVEPRYDWQPLLPSIIFSMRCFARVYGAPFEPDTGDNGWACMSKYKKLRDRLTHPKSSADLQLSDSDLEIAMKATAWFKSTVQNLLKACKQADEHYGSQL
jgi:hypothetical protein